MSPRRRWRSIQGQRSECGDTLIEVLFAIVIISLGVGAVLGALTTSVTSAAEHRSLAFNDALSKSYAEDIVYQIEHNGGYQDCPSGNNALYRQTVPPWNSPPGYHSYSAQIVSVEIWNGSGFGGGCSHTGIQRLTIQSTAPNGVADKLQIVVREADNGAP